MEDKQLIEKAYEAIEIAKNSGKLKRGTNEVTKAVEKAIAKLVVVAKDTSPAEIIMHLGPLCKERKVPMVTVPSKVELGTAAGMPIGASAVAIVQEGEAKNLIKQIADSMKVEDGSS
ncbi:50S ribosomal protein L7ae [Candidatus Woesearchaeota archaeon]|nr:50S ribosomal protein L7ae [Candidatus Woesearchaeota archaeon]